MAIRTYWHLILTVLLEELPEFGKREKTCSMAEIKIILLHLILIGSSKLSVLGLVLDLLLKDHGVEMLNGLPKDKVHMFSTLRDMRTRKSIEHTCRSMGSSLGSRIQGP